MGIPEDEQFEGYLKSFRPLAPDPLPSDLRAREPRRRPMRLVWLSAVAGLLVAALIVRFSSYRGATAPKIANDRPSEHISREPLTVRTANDLLARSPSFKAALEDMSFCCRSIPPAKGQESAIAVLSKEKVRP